MKKITASRQEASVPTSKFKLAVLIQQPARYCNTDHREGMCFRAGVRIGAFIPKSRVGFVGGPGGGGKRGLGQ